MAKPIVPGQRIDGRTEFNQRTKTIHGMEGTPECNAWRSMKRRCYNPKCPDYKNYGGRGLGVCDRLRGHGFFEFMGPRPSSQHSLERPTMDRGYDCGSCEDCLARSATNNCVWVESRKEQARNRRNNRMILYNGETLALSEWAERTGIKACTIAARLDCGWTEEEAITIPVGGSHRKGNTIPHTPPELRERHGKAGTPMYRTWRSMIGRCENLKSGSYGRYGALGCRVCHRWRHSFLAWEGDMGERPSKQHTMHRIDGSRGYECGNADCPDCGPKGLPMNCEWATQKKQNRARKSSRPLEYNGETLCIQEWSERTGIPSRLIIARLEMGWSKEDVLTRPVKKLTRRQREDV